jgi:signal recognition particle subunit SRP54
MGDVLTLVEKAEAAIKEEDAEALTKRLLSAKFDFNDFLKQYKMVSGMGSMSSIMKMLPGGVLSFLPFPLLHANFALAEAVHA